MRFAEPAINRDLWDLACDIAVEYTQKPARRLSIRQHIPLPHAHFREILLLKPLQPDRPLGPPREGEGFRARQCFCGEVFDFARYDMIFPKACAGESARTFSAVCASPERGRRSYRDFLQKFSVLREELAADLDEFDLNYYTYGFRLYRNMPLIEPLESRETKKIREIRFHLFCAAEWLCAALLPSCFGQ